MRMLRKLFVALGSLKLTVLLLLTLGLLTFLGTLAQIQNGLFQSQKLYFDSWLVLHPVRDIKVPLPGGQTVMALFFVNLMVGGFIRMRRTRRLAGVYIVHFGIALLLLAGFVKLEFSDDGYMALWEGDSANFFESHYHWELAVTSGKDTSKEFVVDEGVLQQAHGSRVALRHPDLPFDLIVDAYTANADPQPAERSMGTADVVEGYSLLALPPSVEREHDTPGAYVTLRPKGGPERRMVLFGSSMLIPRARTLPIADETWTIDLRRRRYPLPFALRVDDFRKEEHPGTTMPKLYESDVTQRVDRDERRLKIEMNKPLRDQGYIIFQSSFGPSGPGTFSRYFSQFSVVRNPSDQWPLWSCIVIAVGLLIHFLMMLKRYIVREASAA
ncbi:MAG: cytochrome c biogenesis protein ResB [Planctomycetota bacterium]